MSTGNTMVEAVRQIGVTEQTFYRRRNEYGGLTLDNQILKEAAEGNF